MGFARKVFSATEAGTHRASCDAAAGLGGRNRASSSEEAMDTLVVALLNGVIYGLLLMVSRVSRSSRMMGSSLAHASFYMLGVFRLCAARHIWFPWAALLVSP
jgi:hypothetical protein